MGQARNRGPLEARIDAAVQSKDQRIESLRETLGIPERIKFCGYRVKVDEADEFLGPENAENRYVDSPEKALSFKVFDEAKNQARSEQGEVVVAMFDFGAKLLVAHVPDQTPTMN